MNFNFIKVAFICGPDRFRLRVCVWFHTKHRLGFVRGVLPLVPWDVDADELQVNTTTNFINAAGCAN